jgi:DNA-binding MarR family transcriptional regulator
MTHEIYNDNFRDLALLKIIEADPDVSQAALAAELGFSIGTINGLLRQMVTRGLIEVKRASRRKLRYIITAEGRAVQRTLLDKYIQQSFQLYRRVRYEVKELLKVLNDESGIHAVRLIGEGDIAEVCRLTCLENHITLTDEIKASVLVVDGLDIRIEQL